MASVGYLTYAERRDRGRFPPPGDLVDVPGHGSRHLWRHGPSAGPPIVIVTCLGGSVAGWADLAPRLADSGPVLLYDRAGLGWSPIPRRRWAISLADMVEELDAVLEVSGLQGPYVLVGHSIGGIVARHYAAAHPGRIASLVMIDSSHEDMGERLAAADPPPWWKPWGRRMGTSLTTRIKPIGLIRLAHDLGWTSTRRDALSQFVAPEQLEAAASQALTSQVRWGDAAESAGLDAALRASTLPDLGDIPLIVVTGGPGTYPQRQRWYPEWTKLQAEMVASSTRGEQVMAPNAGHHVHRDEPDLVIGAILTAQRRAAEPS